MIADYFAECQGWWRYQEREGVNSFQAGTTWLTICILLLNGSNLPMPTALNMYNYGCCIFHLQNDTLKTLGSWDTEARCTSKIKYHHLSVAFKIYLQPPFPVSHYSSAHVLYPKVLNNLVPIGLISLISCLPAAQELCNFFSPPSFIWAVCLSCLSTNVTVWPQYLLDSPFSSVSW